MSALCVKSEVMSAVKILAVVSVMSNCGPKLTTF
jgi:hypothetical protein